MLKRWFEFSSNGNGGIETAGRRNGSANQALALMEPEECEGSTEPLPSASQEKDDTVPSGARVDFEEVYRSAALKPPELPYGILKVVEMMNSQHLSSLSPDARRSALLMALEAVGAQVEDLLQDAVVRQRALKDYEDKQQKALRQFEAVKAEENRSLQAELDRLSKDYLTRMQANLDEVAREQDSFQAWQRRKRQEVQQIVEAAAFCVPEGAAPGIGSLATVLERACAAHR
jgi:hypothetical protein